MKIDKTEDGVQIDIDRGHDVLVTIRQHLDYGFAGNVLTKDAEGVMEIVYFHGDGIDGIVVHGPEPFEE